MHTLRDTHHKQTVINTPQQGINWIGSFPNLSGLILKVKEGFYLKDGWINDQLNSYRYSIKKYQSYQSIKIILT